VGSSMRRAVIGMVTAGLLGGAAGCEAGGRSTCREGVCFQTLDSVTVTDDHNRHTLRSPTWGGWIDIQAFEPGEDLPDDLRGLAGILGRRHELQGDLVVSVTAGRLGSRDVAIEEAVITRPSGRFRRLTYLAV